MKQTIIRRVVEGDAPPRIGDRRQDAAQPAAKLRMANAGAAQRRRLAGQCPGAICAPAIDFASSYLMTAVTLLHTGTHFRFRLRQAATFALLAVIASGCSRNRPPSETVAVAAMPPQLPAIEFAGAWGVRGEQPGQLEQPVGLAADAAGRIYIADRSTGFVEKFEAGGTNLLTFEDAAARGASAIAVDSGGGIYIANARAGEISVFFPEGDLLRVFHVTPQRGFGGPYSFTVSTDGRLFVPDPAGGKIEVLSSRGRLEKAWNVVPAMALPREQARPVIAAAAPDGFVYVGEARTGRIVKFSGQGEPVAVMATDGCRFGAAAGAGDFTEVSFRAAIGQSTAANLDAERRTAALRRF